MCRICENNIAGPAGNRVANIMQDAADGSKSVCTMFAQRAGTPFIVSAAPNKFWFWQIFNTCNSLRFICYIFARSKHLDNLQHRFIFPCWNIGTKSQNTSKILCILATVSIFSIIVLSTSVENNLHHSTPEVKKERDSFLVCPENIVSATEGHSGVVPAPVLRVQLFHRIILLYLVIQPLQETP